MAKIVFTNELACTIKTLRIENGMSAKQLANNIAKSSSYITKLEKGEIHSIDEEGLLQILKLILGDQEDTEIIIDSVFKTLSYKYTTDEIKEFLWFHNFDTVIRQIPVPETFYIQINQLMADHNISIEYLTKRINSNEFIPDKSVCDTQKYPPNVWFDCKINGKNESYILMQVQEEQIRKLLNGSIAECNYVTLLAIVLYINKIIIYGEQKNLESSMEDELNQKAKDFLATFRILTLTDKQRRIDSAKTKAEQELALSEYDIENIELMNAMLSFFSVHSTFDIKTANADISSFVKNLEWDTAFMMRMVALPFFELAKSSFRIKKAVLSEIEKTIQMYLELSPAERSVEEY
jgi:transcriptional regulator with XRE-family HTH domain